MTPLQLVALIFGIIAMMAIAFALSLFFRLMPLRAEGVSKAKLIIAGTASLRRESYQQKAWPLHATYVKALIAGALCGGIGMLLSLVVVLQAQP